MWLFWSVELVGWTNWTKFLTISDSIVPEHVDPLYGLKPDAGDSEDADEVQEEVVEGNGMN